MKIRFVFDVEAQDLHQEGFSYGYVVAEVNPVTNEFHILEQGECHSIAGAQAACDWVKSNVIPSIPALQPYLNANIALLDANALPSTVVRTNRELRDKFYSLYKKYKDKDKEMEVEFWSDVNFPVETNFLSAIVNDCSDGTRDFEMPYPLRDLANLLDVNVKRSEYCGLNGLVTHHPVDDAMTILYSLQKIETELKTSKFKLPAIISNQSQSKLRFVFDIGAQDLQLSAFAFGYVVTRTDEVGLQIIEKGQCYSIYGALGAKEYVQENSLPCLKILKPYLAMDEEMLKSINLPRELVLTVKDLRERFYSIYTKWRSYGAEIYSSDVNFPVETNFLSAIVQDGNSSRDWEMPYPLNDISSMLAVDVSRADYTGLKGLVKGNPLSHALASSCALHMAEATHTSQNNSLEDELALIRTKYQEHLQQDEPTYSYADTLRMTGSPIFTETRQSSSLGTDLDYGF